MNRASRKFFSIFDFLFSIPEKPLLNSPRPFPTFLRRSERNEQKAMTMNEEQSAGGGCAFFRGTTFNALCSAPAHLSHFD
jgi:hypothetical protein